MKIIYFLLLVVVNQISCYCIPPSSNTYNASTVFLNDQIADFDYARVTLYKYIDCCAQDYHKMLWYFQKKGESKWQLFPWFPIDGFSDMQPSLENKNKTLEIKRVGYDNEGIYKCVALSPENNVLAEHTTTIEVFSCTDRVKPIAYGPKDKYTSIGQNVTFTCTGDFGCNSDSARDISWYDDHWNTMNDSSLPRYKVSKVERRNYTIVEVNFTIIGVTKEDFSKTFVCWVSSSYSPGNQHFDVKLKKTSLQVHTVIPAEVLTGIGSAIAFVLIIVIIMVALFYPKVKLIALSRLPSCHLDDIGDKEYHALILHDEVESDINFARELKKQLKADSYNIMLSGDITAGHGILHRIQDYTEQSKSLIIIYPLDRLTENFERMLGAQAYFKPNLITVVKKRTEGQMTMRTLEDKGLVKLFYTPRQNNIYCHYKFYCKLKLRMPRKVDKRGVCCLKGAPEERRAEINNLLTGTSPNVSPFTDDQFNFENHRNNGIV